MATSSPVLLPPAGALSSNCPDTYSHSLTGTPAASFFQGESDAVVAWLLTRDPGPYVLVGGVEEREAVYREGMYFCARAALALALWAFPEFDLAPGIAREALVPQGANPIRVLAAFLADLSPEGRSSGVPLGAWADQTLRAVGQHVGGLIAQDHDLSPWVALVFITVNILNLGRHRRFEDAEGRVLEGQLGVQLRNLHDAYQCAVLWRMAQDGADGWRVPGEVHAMDQAFQLLVEVADRVRHGEADRPVVLTQGDVLMVALSRSPRCAEAATLLAGRVRG